MSEENPIAPAGPQEGSVVDQILDAFVAKVEAEAGFAEAGGRLRKALFESRKDTEAELRAALFGGAAE